jgi:hypothetical protein
MKSDRLTLFAGLTLLIPPLLGLFFGFLYARDQTTTVFYPIPALYLLSGLFVGPVAVAVPMVLFFIWNAELFNGAAKVPKRTYVLLAIATLLSPLWFLGGWKNGIIVQGSLYNFLVLGINVVWITVLWFMFARNWKTEPDFKVNLFLHWLLFLWLSWYAFPFFGEMI